MYIPDLPTYIVFYLETTRGSSIDTPTMTPTPTPTHFKSFYSWQAKRGFATDKVLFLSLSIMGMYHRVFGGGWGVVDWRKGGTLCKLWNYRDVNPLQAAHPSNTIYNILHHVAFFKLKSIIYRVSTIRYTHAMSHAVMLYIHTLIRKSLLLK